MAISGSDQQLIDQWKNEPAPLLPLLHAFHNRDGYLSDDALRAVSKGLKHLSQIFTAQSLSTTTSHALPADWKHLVFAPEISAAFAEAMTYSKL